MIEKLQPLVHRLRRRSVQVMAIVALSGFALIGLADPNVSGQILYSVTTVMAFAFAYIYASGSNWRATAPGRALLYLVGMFASFLAWVSVSFWIGQNYEDTKSIIRGVLLVVLIVLFVNLVDIVWRMQRYQVDQDAIDVARQKVCPNESRTEDSGSA